MFEPHGLYHTPKDMAELNLWIERHSPEERAHLYILQGMYYNLIVSNFDLAPKVKVADSSENNEVPL